MYSLSDKKKDTKDACAFVSKNFGLNNTDWKCDIPEKGNVAICKNKDFHIILRFPTAYVKSLETIVMYKEKVFMDSQSWLFSNKQIRDFKFEMKKYQ